MPLDDGPWLDDDENLLPALEATKEESPEQPIQAGKSRPPAVSMEYGELMSEHQVLGLEGELGSEDGSEQ